MHHPMITLWTIADPRKLTDEVLDELRVQTDVTNQLDCLSEVIEDIGCLVGSDEAAGNFANKDDFPQLMFSLSSTISNLSAMAWVGNEARSIIQDRAKNGGMKS
ncbi:MAG: hypothetical protein PHV02_12090 [Rhodocyclaceae bacterium]|nr:hypothetical protein [Rhodocyclaceae bacterium]